MMTVYRIYERKPRGRVWSDTGVYYADAASAKDRLERFSAGHPHRSFEIRRDVISWKS